MNYFLRLKWNMDVLPNQNGFAINLQSSKMKSNEIEIDVLVTKITKQKSGETLYRLENIQRILLLTGMLLCAMIILFYWILLLKNVRKATSVNFHPYNTMICKYRFYSF